MEDNGKQDERVEVEAEEEVDVEVEETLLAEEDKVKKYMHGRKKDMERRARRKARSRAR